MKRVKAAAMVIAFSLLVVAIAIQPVSANPDTRRESLVGYINDNYDTSDGGYMFPDETISRIDPTYGAITILDALGILDNRPPVINITKVKSFAEALHWTSGGEDHERYGGFSEYIAGPVDMQSTYDTINLIELVDIHQDVPGINDVEINKTQVLIWLNKTQTDLGGFGDREGDSPDLLSTYRALHVMNLVLEDLEDDTWEEWLRNKTTTIDWILSCRDGDAFKLSPASSTPGVTSTAAAVMALNILGELSNLDNLEGVRGWLLDRQILDSDVFEFIGGFNEGVGTNDSNIATTWYALKGLETLTALDQVDAEAAAEFILNCQAADGSWGLVPGISSGRLYFAGQAIESLTILGDTYITMLNQENPHNIPPPLIDWRWAVVIGIIITAIILGLVALRLD